MATFSVLTKLFSQVQASERSGKKRAIDSAFSAVRTLVLKHARSGKKVMLVGNGGSASVASHIAVDLLKNVGIPALAFNDASFLTCLSNDLGYESVFAKPIEMLSGKGDVLFAISSSGKSANILAAVAQARRNGCTVITFSGFKKGNPLRTRGDMNFYVPSSSYGDVEIVHLALCHAIVDSLMK